MLSEFAPPPLLIINLTFSPVKIVFNIIIDKIVKDFLVNKKKYFVKYSESIISNVRFPTVLLNALSDQERIGCPSLSF